MSAEVNRIETYKDAEGHSLFEFWLKGLKDQKARYAIVARLDRLRLGNAGYCRDLADGVWEMKIDFGPGYRVYFARSGRTVYLLLAGGDKKTQNADIKTAKKLLAEYKSGKKE